MLQWVHQWICHAGRGLGLFLSLQYRSFIALLPRHMTDVYQAGITLYMGLPLDDSIYHDTQELIWAYYWIQRNKSFRGGIQITSLWVHELTMIIIMICTGLVGANQYHLLWINNWAIWISRGGFKFFFSLRIVVYWCHYRYFESEHCNVF